MNEQLGGGRYEEPKSINIYKDLKKEVTEYPKIEGDFPKKIEKSDISPRPINADETEIVAQRHGDYVRDRNDSRVGSLTPEAELEVRETAENYFRNLVEQTPAEERHTLDVLFVTSDTQYFEGGRRSVETADIAEQAAIKIFEEYGIPLENIHNTRGKLKGISENAGPRPMPGLREPQFLDNNPNFANQLLQKYSQTEGPNGEKKLDVNFWIAFETDVEAELRQQHGAEGPDDIAERTAHSINVLGRYAQVYHKLNPGRRLVVWAATHYDTISPYVRRDVLQQENYKDESLGVALGGGITIHIDSVGRATTEIADQSYDVPLKTSGKRTS